MTDLIEGYRDAVSAQAFLGAGIPDAPRTFATKGAATAGSEAATDVGNTYGYVQESEASSAFRTGAVRLAFPRLSYADAPPVAAAELEAMGQGWRELWKTFRSSSTGSGFTHTEVQPAAVAVQPLADGPLLQLLYKPAKKLRDEDIANAIVELSALLSNGEFATVDALFEAADATRLSVEMMITLLRTSYTARASLPNWTSLLQRAAAELTTRGRDPARVLRGLYAAT